MKEFDEYSEKSSHFDDDIDYMKDADDLDIERKVIQPIDIL